MARGRKKGQRINKKTDDPKELTSTSQTETKENKPAPSKKFNGKTQTILQRLLSPKTSRSPLSDSSSQQILDDNDCEATKDESAKTKSGSSDVEEEQQDEDSCHGPKTKEDSAEASQQNELTLHCHVKSVTHDKVSESGQKSNKGHKPRRKKTEDKVSQNKKVTDYFPIRRSNRKTKTEIQSEEGKLLDDLIIKGMEEGLEVRHIEEKGRGIFAVKAFRKGDYVVEYHGDLLDLAEAKLREARYAEDPQAGCYMYYFQYLSKNYCIDATRETSRLGRLVNHSKSGNCQTKLHAIRDTPHLILVASRDIEAGEELLYDYGDRSKESINAHPWLKY